jgi:CRP/FNR family transcriptional regulator, dissimilatory nitrate respiration regulator
MLPDDGDTELRGIPLFSELCDEDLALLHACSTESRVPRGTLLFREGDTYQGFYVVLQGAVKVFKLSVDGKETVLHIMRPPNPLAEIPMFLGEGYPAFAETVEDSRLLCVRKQGFLDLLRARPDLALKMLAGLSRRLKMLGELMEQRTAQDVKTRVAQYLLDLADVQRPTGLQPAVTLQVAKTLLAADLGTIIETLSRTFRKLEEEGLIRMHRRTVILTDLPRLQREYGRARH